MSAADGKGGVVRELVRGARSEWEAMQRAAEGEQITMFPIAARGRAGKPGRLDGMQREAERRALPGRPPGAQNLTTQGFRKWLLERGVSPLVSLMRYAIMPPDMLAQELGCSKLDAFREWRILQSELAPFLHAKLGFVDDDGRPVPSISMVIGGHHVTLQSGMTPWQMREKLAQENQAFLAPALDVSQSDVSQKSGQGA